MSNENMTVRSESRTAGSAGLRVRNAIASGAVVAFACGAYAVAPYNRERMNTAFGTPDHYVTGDTFLATAAAIYVALLFGYYLRQRDPMCSKSLRFFGVIARVTRSPSQAGSVWSNRDDRTAVLTTLLKAFFGPFMVMALVQHVVGGIMVGRDLLLQADGVEHRAFELFNSHGYWLAMKLILFVDVALFTVGYLVELPRLGNQIRSVDPTVLGWAAALLCYPPFNSVTGAILGSSVSDFPQFDDPATHIAMNVALLLLMTIYASASVALGWKASNLTHRGIVVRGPYAVVRHPAYASKNIAWWIGAAPMVSIAFHESLFAGISAVASVAGWSLLYVLRAVTEEDHLRSVDGEYAAYAAKVRWRFIPRIL